MPTQRPTRFKCDICEVECKSKFMLEMHGIFHLSPSQKAAQTCGICEKPFPTIAKFLSHQARKQCHPKQGRTSSTCLFCDKVVGCNRSLEAHMRLHTNETPFQCRICTKSFAILQGVRTHMVTHTGERPFQCDLCEKRFTFKTNMQAHRRKHLLPMDSRRYQCTLCKQEYRSSASLKNHRKRIHFMLRTLPCKFCAKMFRTNTELEKHLRMHIQERPLKCKTCSKRFRSLQDLSCHKTSYCDGKYLCKVFNKRFADVYLLAAHKNIHKVKKEFKFIFCEKGFSTPEIVSQHLYIHTRERPYFCKICPYGCTTTNALKVHGRKHLRQRRRVPYVRPEERHAKNYKCDICKERFVHAKAYVRHMKIHGVEKPFLCVFCNKWFSAEGPLYSHILCHTEELPFECKICPFATRVVTLLTCHMENHAKQNNEKC